MQLLANKVHIQGVTLYWLTKCMHKQEPHSKYMATFHIGTQVYTQVAVTRADATIFYCYLCRDGCVKHSHLQCGSCCDSRNTRGMTSSNIADRILISFTAVQSSNQLLGAVTSYTGSLLSQQAQSVLPCVYAFTYTEQSSRQTMSSSSWSFIKSPANWRDTATYVGMFVE